MTINNTGFLASLNRGAAIRVVGYFRYPANRSLQAPQRAVALTTRAKEDICRHVKLA